MQQPITPNAPNAPNDARPPPQWQDGDAAALSATVLNLNENLGVIFTDLEGVITGWSQGATFIIGYEAHEVIGQSLGIIFKPEDRERELLAHELRMARDLGAAEDERWHLRKDGSEFWASGSTLRVVRDGVHTGYLKTLKDSTHIRTRVTLLENEVEQLARRSDAKDHFHAVVAHELRNPLAPLKSVASLLQQQDKSGSQAPLLKVLHRQLAFLERMVEDLVDSGRVQTGKLSLNYRTVELQTLLNGALESSREQAVLRGVQLEALMPEVPLSVVVDPDRLYQAVVNLLANAVKFTPAGGSVSLLANVDESHFQVHVKDTGQGIDRDLLPRIFEMFTQAERGATHRRDGLGIGLALVKQIASLHHGSVDARSEGRGKGAEFILRIPLQNPAPGQP